MSTDSDKTTDQPKLNPEWVKAGPEADLSFVIPEDIKEKAVMVYGVNMLVLTMEKYKELLEENTKLKKALDYLRELREGDFELTRALAEAAGIPITASNSAPGTQWEQFHDGVMKLKIELAECRRARDMDQVRNWPNHYREE